MAGQRLWHRCKYIGFARWRFYSHLRRYAKKNDNNWVLPEGKYYLKDDITVEYAIVISGKVTICLNGKTITGKTAANHNTTYPVFRVASSGSLTLTDCKENSGKVTHSGYSAAYGVPSGVQVLKDGTFIMYGGKISGNAIEGVSLTDDGGIFHMYGGEISGNQDGVYVGNSAVFNMSGGTIKNHKRGKGVYCKGEFNMSGGTISDCSDGVYLTCYQNTSGRGYGYGKFKMTGGKITGNYYGVALYAYFDSTNGVRNEHILKRSEFTMTGGEITGNTNCGVDAGASSSSSGSNTAAGGTLLVGGTAKIQNNGTENYKCNVYLDEGEIKLASTALTEGAYIGITPGANRRKTLTAGNPDTIVAVRSQRDVSGYFHSDRSEYEIQNGENNQVLLALKPHTHIWNYTTSGYSTVSVSCTGTAGTCDYQTTPATLTISMDKDVYAYDVNMTAPKATLTHSANWPSDLAEAKESGIKYWKSTDGGSSYSVQITTPDELKAVGKYLAQLKFNDKYIDVKFSVVDYSRKDPIYTPPTAKKSLVYNGKNQALINKGTVQGGTMYYRLGTDSTSSVLVPAPISAATYDVYYKIIGDEGYNDVAEQRITVTISKAALTGTPTFTPVTEAGKKLADVKLTAPVDWPVGSFSWKPAGETTSQDTEITKGTSSRWIFVPNDTTNYTGIDGDLVLWSSTGGTSSGGGYYTPSSAVTTSGSIDSKVTSSPTEVKRETKTDTNGSSVTTATVTVSAANQREILRQAKANKSGEIVIKISQNDVKDAAKIALQLEKSFIEAVVTDTDAKLIIQTPDGEWTFTQDELKKLAAEATDKIVTVDPAEAEPTQPEQPADTLTPAQEKLVKGVENTNIDLRSQRTPGGNILLTWAKEKGYKVDYFEIYRSTKRSSGYGRKPFFRTPNGNWTKYLNTKNIKEGSTYYYKIRGVRIIDGKKYYTEYSSKAWRSVK